MKVKLIIVLFTLPFVLMAQSQWGLYNSHLSGVSSLPYNPASFHHSPYQWDFQLIAGGTFFENDFAYIENTNAAELLFNDRTLIEDGTLERKLENHELRYGYFKSTQNMTNVVQAFLSLPSFALRLNRKWSVGFFSKFRQVYSSGSLDEDFNYHSITSWEDGETKIFDPLRTSGMVWNEAALSVSHQIFKKGRSSWALGGNLKFLTVFQALYVFNPGKTAMVKDGDRMWVSAEKVNFGFTESNNLANGHGFGLDIGFENIIQSNDKPYEWRWGASLNDIGLVQAKGQAHAVEKNQVYAVDGIAFDQVTDLQSLAQVLSEEALGASDASLKDNEFYLGTPTHLNIHVDYALSEKVFLSAQSTRYVALRSLQLEKENVVALGVRYSKSYWEVGAPLVLENDRNLRIGFWFRMGPLTIGSDHFASLFIDREKFTGSDLYFAIKLNNLGIPKKGKTPDQCHF